MCKFLVLIILTSISGEQAVDITAVKNTEDVTKIRALVESRAFRASVLQQGIVDAKIHDVKKVKPFKCN